jgi:hypothetical protein
MFLSSSLSFFLDAEFSFLSFSPDVGSRTSQMPMSRSRRKSEAALVLISEAALLLISEAALLTADPGSRTS